MRLNRLDLNLLVALDALLSECSITRAADRLFLSQPATSGALARLREYFQDELLVRVGARMMPTPLGESLRKPVHDILLQIQATVDRGVAFEPESSERCFRVLASDYSVSTLFASVVRHVAPRAPKIQFEFVAPTENPSEHLEQGNVDFLVMPEVVTSVNHPRQSLFEETFVCIGCRDNQLLTDALSLEEFLALGHVTALFGANRARTLDQRIMQDKLGLELRVEVVASTFDAIPQFLPGTDRVATVYRRLAEFWVQALPLKMVASPAELAPVPWSLQWHTLRDLDPGIQWLREQIAEVAATAGPRDGAAPR